jgi:hypothetical protein
VNLFLCTIKIIIIEFEKRKVLKCKNIKIMISMSRNREIGEKKPLQMGKII